MMIIDKCYSVYIYIGKKMAGRFEGLSHIEWKLFEDIFPISPEKRGKGMPHTPRTICTIILFSTY